MADFNQPRLSRRLLLGSIAAVPAAAFARARLPLATPVARARPDSPAWPTKAEWDALSSQVGGRLIPGGRASAAPPAELLSNPFYVGDQVGLTQSTGWLGAWTA